MSDNILFYLVFSSQIWLMSYYYPGKVLNRMKVVMKNHPIEKYPKLYPGSVNAAKRSQRIYKNMNQLLILIGLVLMYLYAQMSIGYDASQKHAEGMPIFFGLAQFIPIIFLQLSENSQFKKMRKANKSSKRVAELQSRGLFDFISPRLFILAVAFFIGGVLFQLLITDFVLTENLIVMISTLFACNILFAIIIITNISGKKINPHLAHKDRIKQIEFTIHSLVYTSILVSIFFILTTAMRTYNLEHLEIIVNSIYFQALGMLGIGAMLRTIKIEDMDFEDYKADVSTS